MSVLRSIPAIKFTRWLLFVALFSLPASAAYQIAGTVVNDSLKPVPGAQVKLQQAGFSTMTNATGAFVVSDIQGSTSLLDGTGPRLQQGKLHVRSSRAGTVRIDVVGLDGRIVYSHATQIQEGEFLLDLPSAMSSRHSATIVLLRVQTPDRFSAVVRLSHPGRVQNELPDLDGNVDMKIELVRRSAAIDTLLIFAPGYESGKMAVSLISQNLGQIKLAKESANNRYLDIVQTFADNLITKGVDNFGTRKTAMWAAVIDASALTVPSGNVPECCGIRNGDRAVGGSNLLHDAVTIQTFPVLSAITGNSAYKNAAHAYARDFMTYAGGTGRVSWGEHRYYNIFTDKTAGTYHEYLEWSVPWKLLWDANQANTKNEIVTISRGHSCCPTTPSSCGWRYNRHDDKCGGSTSGGMPWIKHGSLYGEAYSFLYSKTGDASLLNYAKGFALYDYNHRNTSTNIPPACYGGSCDHGSTGILWTQHMSQFVYWTLRAWKLNPEKLLDLKTIPVALMKNYWSRAYKDGKIAGGLYLNGSVESWSGSPWDFGYESRSNGLPYLGRVAAYAARVTNTPEFASIAKVVADKLRAASVPSSLTPQGPGFAIHLSLDLYDLTKEQKYLDDAKKYADMGITKVWNGKFVTRLPGNKYYEAKTGAGDFISGLLRLHLRMNRIADPGLYDWSF